jgi:4-hydroxy-tetrahydrodipicolinate reductase
MGQVIERIALERGHEIVLKKTNIILMKAFQMLDVAIDFSIPTAAVSNISNCSFQRTCDFRNNRMVLPLTKWSHYAERKTAFISSSNFSLGVYCFSGIDYTDGRGSSYTKTRCT